MFKGCLLINILYFLFYFFKDDLYRKKTLIQNFFPNINLIYIMLFYKVIQIILIYYMAYNFMKYFNNKAIYYVFFLILVVATISASLINFNNLFVRYNYNFFKLSSKKNNNYINKMILSKFLNNNISVSTIVIPILLISYRHTNITIVLLFIILSYVILLLRMLLYLSNKRKIVSLFIEYVAFFMMGYFFISFLWKLLIHLRMLYAKYGFSNKSNLILNNSLNDFCYSTINKIDIISEYTKSNNNWLLLLSLLLLILIIILSIVIKNYQYRKNTKNKFNISKNNNLQNNILYKFNKTNFDEDSIVLKNVKLQMIIPPEEFCFLGIIIYLFPKLNNPYVILALGTMIFLYIMMNMANNVIGLSSDVFNYKYDYKLIDLFKMSTERKLIDLTNSKVNLIDSLINKNVILVFLSMFFLIEILTLFRGSILIFPMLFLLVIKKRIFKMLLKTKHDLFYMVSKSINPPKFEDLSDVAGSGLIKEKNNILFKIINSLFMFTIMMGFIVNLFNGNLWLIITIIYSLLLLIYIMVNSSYTKRGN